ncbi:hypothetical protein NL676_020308 [Syzygium grande]|nr:hypothetical protein NL676_020308 [Syzygium grande]
MPLPRLVDGRTVTPDLFSRGSPRSRDPVSSCLESIATAFPLSLSLRTSTGKVMLYDGGEQLLECRILKNDEAICFEFWLSFWCKVHYNPLYEIRDAPIPHKLKKKH